MGDKVIIFTRATVPAELAQAWLQHLRDFDAAHPGCHFEVFADAMAMTMAEVIEAMRVNPELTFRKIIERKT
jgi:hypothetical protein